MEKKHKDYDLEYERVPRSPGSVHRHWRCLFTFWISTHSINRPGPAIRPVVDSACRTVPISI
eukprot:7806785-Karenia_brevis.AAC.1